MSLYVGLDIGGTKLLVASADSEGSILKRVQEPTPLDRDEGIAALHRMIAATAGDEKITAIGAAIGGPLDWEKGIVSPLHQPQWRDVPLKAMMKERWGCPFFVDVDTNVAALGEYYFGKEEAPRLLYLTVSTGMGGVDVRYDVAGTVSPRNVRGVVGDGSQGSIYAHTGAGSIEVKRQ